jgi:hypothetical protein
MTTSYQHAKFDGDVIESVDLSADAAGMIDMVIRKMTGTYQSSFESQIVNDLDQAMALAVFDRLQLSDAQRQAVLRVFHRGPVTKGYRNDYDKPLTVGQFCRTIDRAYFSDGSIMVPWQGMVLLIEKDGYVHS